jgi:hypothetical protein
MYLHSCSGCDLVNHPVVFALRYSIFTRDCCADYQNCVNGYYRYHLHLYNFWVAVVLGWWRDASIVAAMKIPSIIVYRKTKERLEREAQEQQRLRDIENDPRRDNVCYGSRIYPLIEDE